MISGGYESVIAWDLHSSIGRQKMKMQGHKYDVSAVAYSPDGRFILSGGQDTKLVLWDARNGQTKCELHGHNDEVTSIDFSKDGKYFASASKDRTIVVWNIESLSEKIRLVGHLSNIEGISFSPDGSTLASGSGDHTMIVWCCDSGRQKMKLHRDEPVNCVKFAPDGLSILSGGNDNAVRVSPFVAWAYFLPSAVHQEIFKNDMMNLRLASSKIWNDTSIAFLLESNPDALCNTREDDGLQQNLVHLAAKAGCSGFLSKFIGDVGPRTHSIGAMKRALSACLMRDSSNRSPLFYAVSSQDSGSVSSILKCLMLSFDDVFTKLQIEHATHHHSSDIFPLSDFLYAVDKFPTTALKFLGELRLLDAYEALVLKDCDKAPLNDKEKDVRGSDERSPIDFWKKFYPPPAISPDGSYTEDTDSLIAVTAKLIPIKDLARSNFLKVAVTAAEQLKTFSVFENEVLMCLINFKWENHIKRRFMSHLYMDLIMAALYTSDALLHTINSTDGSEDLNFYMMVPSFLILIPWAFFVNHEIRQFKAGKVNLRRHIMGSILNFMDFTSLLLIISTFLIRMFQWSTQLFDYADAYFGKSITKDSNRTSTITLAVGLPVIYLNLLKYMQGFRVSGELVSMIFGILKGIVSFTIILGIIVIGFALGFFVLFNTQQHDVGGQATVGVSMLTGYAMMYGEIGDMLESFGSSTSYYATAGLFVMFMYLVNVVLLNLLIAIMGDIFDQIQEHSHAQFLYSKACLILEFEQVLPSDHWMNDTSNHSIFPVWLQVLQPIRGDRSDDDTWSGKMRAIKGAIAKANMVTEAACEGIGTNLKHNSSEISEVKEEVGELRMVLLKMLQENMEITGMLKEIRQENKELKELINESQQHHRHHHHHKKTPLPTKSPSTKSPSKKRPAAPGKK